jgi:hypothetical protein
MNKQEIAISAELVDAVLEAIGDRSGEMPVIITSPGLKQRSQPYARPVAYSLGDAQAVLNRCRQYNPVDDLLTDSVTGPGALVVGLDGAPGAATGSDRSALIPGWLLDVSKNANVSPTPFTIDASGAFEDGSTYTMPSCEFIWTPEAGDVEQILVLGAENTARGPMLRSLRLTTEDFPAQFNGNGSPAMVAGEQLTVNVTAAAAGMSFSLAAITAQHAAYDLLKAVLSTRLHSDAPKILEAGARLRDIVPERAKPRILTGRIPVSTVRSK